MAESFDKRVKNQEEINSELYLRMLGDEHLVYLFEYVMRDADLKKVPNIINVTLNRPAVFAANIISALGTTSEQRVVESDDKNLDTSEIEEFQKAAFAQANDRLRRQGRPQINPFFDIQLSIRGRGAARCIFQMVDDVLEADISPWDTRFVTYEMGVKGLDFAAYTTRRAKDVIEAEYGELINHFKVTFPTAGGKVLDGWDTEHNEVWVEGKKIFEQEHSFGFTPVVIQVVSLGYGAILLGDDRIRNEGESIFFLIRGVIPELNRLASIMQTLNLKSVLAPQTWKSKEGQGATPPKHEDVTGLGAITAADIGGGAEAVNFGDAQRSATLALAMFDNAIGEGSLSSADLGTIGSPPASGIRAIIAGENRDQVVAPRLEAKALLNESLAEMFTEQVIQIGGSVELGVRGHKRTFQTSKLAGEYTTTYKYTAKSPITDAGLFSLAAAAGSLVSEKYKREDILQLQDPEGEKKQLRLEEAERLSPAIKINRIIKDLVDMGEDFEAELLSAEMGINLKRMLAGDIGQQPKPEKKDEPTQVLSLFGGGGGGTPRTTPEGE